jgi:hypothetical protein
VVTPAPDAAPVETLQPVAETVGQAVHETVTAPQPEPAPKEFDEIREKVAIGASAAAEIPNMQTMMNAHMSVCKAFGVTDSRSKCVLDALGVANIMQITEDNKKAWFVRASESVVSQLEMIKADETGEMLKMVLDSVQ